MTERLTLAEISAEGINTNFSDVEDAINAKADLNGDIQEKFNVANAVELTEAINKGQLDSIVNGINDDIDNLETEVSAKANQAYVDSALETKLDISDPTVTKQGNTFNGPNQLVQLNSSGQLPALDGSLLTGISSGATLDTSNMQTLANNSVDADNDIDFSEGFCWDSTLAFKITSTAMTKRLDANFVEGTNQGGLDTGSKINSSWYHCFVIAKSDGTSDFLFSISKTSPTMPTGYIYKRCIGSIKTNASGNIIRFKQNSDYFWFTSPITDLYLSNVGNISLTDLITSCAPNALGIFSATVIDNPSNSGSVLSIADKTNGSTLRTVAQTYGVNQNRQSNDFLINVDNESKIQYSHSYIAYVATHVVIICLGYIDSRGKK